MSDHLSSYRINSKQGAISTSIIIVLQEYLYYIDNDCAIQSLNL